MIAWIVSLAGSLAAALPVAIAPVEAERVSLGEVPLYSQLDDALRAAVLRAGIPLQDKETTAESILAVRQALADCSADNVECMSKAAVLSGVSRLIVPIVRRDGDLFKTRLLLVDGSGHAVEIEGLMPIPRGDAVRTTFQKQAASALIAAAVNADIAPRPAKVAEPEAVLLDADPADAGGRALFVSPAFGIGALSVGGLLVVGGATGLFVMDQSLGSPARFEDRAPYMIGGQVSAALAGVGVLAAGVGAAALAMSP